MTPTQTLDQAKHDFEKIYTDAPVDLCVRKGHLTVIQYTIRELVDGLTATVAKRKIAVKPTGYSKGMASKEKSQEKLIAACQTFLEEMAAKRGLLKSSHDALTCFTCRRKALMQSSDRADHAAAWELQKGRYAEIAAYKAELVVQKTRRDARADEMWYWHCMHN
jgi:hypothetical protein